MIKQLMEHLVYGFQFLVWFVTTTPLIATVYPDGKMLL